MTETLKVMSLADQVASMQKNVPESINTTFQTTFPELGAEHFIGRIPQWIGVFWSSLFVIVGGEAVWLITRRIDGLSSVLIVLLIVSIFAVAVVFWVATGAIQYVCDAQGVYFPAQTRRWWSNRIETWLLVPWVNITSIQTQLMLDESGSRQAVTLRLRTSDEERRVFFNRCVMPNPDHQSMQNEEGLMLIGFPTMWRSPYQTAALLCRFKRGDYRSPIHGLTLASGR